MYRENNKRAQKLSSLGLPFYIYHGSSINNGYVGHGTVFLLDLQHMDYLQLLYGREP